VADVPVLVLDDGVTPCVVVQNDLIRYLFADDPEVEDEWQPAPPS
jgi:hypothetical protein